MSFSFFRSGEVLAPAQGGTGAQGFTLGSVVFVGSSGVYNQNNGNFFWDNTHSRLGLGTSSPAYLLDVNGDINLSGILRVGGIAFSSSNLSDAANLLYANGSDPLTANLSAAGFLITNLGTPTNPGDSASKSYVDSVAQGLVILSPVEAIAVSNITLSGTQTIDGYAAQVGDRILVTAQTSGINNGIYIVASGAWSRSTDMAAGSHAAKDYTFVQNGSTYGGSAWVCTNTAPNDLVGTDSLVFSQFSAASQINAGTGLSKTGSTISLITPVVVGFGGTGGTTFTAHGVIIGEGTSAFSVTSTGTSGQALLSGGASADPAYGALNLAGGSSIVTGVLPVANGGTNAASLSGNAILSTNSAGDTVTSITSGTSNQVIAWNGSTWMAVTLALSYLSDGTNVVDAVSPAAPIIASITGHTLSVSVSSATTGALGVVQLAGDIGGTATSVSVLKLQGNAVSANTPTSNQALVWNSSNSDWEPTTLSLSYLSDGTNVVDAVTPSGPITASITGHTLSVGISSASADTPNYVVQRDGSGNFVANTISLDANLLPTVTGVSNLGSSSLRFSTLYLASVIDFTSNLLFETSGSELFRFTTGGRLGVGTPTPGYPLDVNGDINAAANVRTNGTARLDSSGNLTNIGNITGTGGIVITATGANSLSFSTNGSSRVIIDSSGNFQVGGSTAIDANRNLLNIGNITGTGAVTLTATGANSLSFATNGSTRAVITSAGAFQVGGSTVIDASRNLLNIGNITGTAGVTLTATSATLALAAMGSNPITLSVNGSEAARVSTAGNVLIGTISDDGNGALQVNGVIESKTGGFRFPDGTSLTSASALPQWTKYTVPYTSFTNASNTQSATLFTLPAAGIIHAVKIKHTTSFSTPSSDFFTTKANVNSAFQNVGQGFVINGLGYAAAGDNTGGSEVGTTQSYNDSTNAWTTQATAATPVNYPAEFALNGFGYLAGGYDSGTRVATVQKYNATANTWGTVTSLGSGLNGNTGFSLNGFGYSDGGYNGSYLTTNNQYNDSANSWTAQASLSAASYVGSGYTIGSYNYMVGGAISGSAISSTNEQYNDAANIWITKQTMTTVVWNHGAAFSVNGYGYIIGGSTSNVSNNYILNTQRYDPVLNSWLNSVSTSNYLNTAAGFGLNNFGYAASGITFTTSAGAGATVTSQTLQLSNALTGYTLSVGLTTSPAKYASAFDVFQTVADTAVQMSQDLAFESQASTTSVQVTATSTGTTLNNVTQGSASIWVLASATP